jgi:hypothetical protein
MAADNSVDPAGWFAEQIGACEPDLLRSMVKTMAAVSGWGDVSGRGTVTSRCKASGLLFSRSLRGHRPRRYRRWAVPMPGIRR